MKPGPQSLQTLVPWIVALLVASVAVMVFGAARGDQTVVAAAAAFFATAMIATAVRINAPAWQKSNEAASAADAPGLARRNTRLAALVYAWGGAAMLGVYSLAGLSWRHGWQYGLAMAIVAALLLLYVRHLGRQVRPEMPPLALTLLHGAAAAVGLGFLVGSGKLATTKGDWAANDVFLGGGVAIVLLCVVAGVTQSRLSKKP